MTAAVSIIDNNNSQQPITPTLTGTLTAVITIGDTTGNSPQSISLSGTGH